EAIDLDSIRAQGYAFQVELTYRAIQTGFEVVEVPIVFRDREIGTSKMSTKITLEAAVLVPQLRFRKFTPLRGSLAEAETETDAEAEAEVAR
ncbi:MAG: polyprenol monophosphomannose synthase, partial [Solirubrobacteraceae bacterium]